MVAVVRDAAVSEDGVVSAPVSGGRWGTSAETVVLPSCGSSGLMFKPVRTMWCTSHNAPVVVIAQPMCYGPAHFLAECLPRLLMALSAARREGALVHVTQANPMLEDVGQVTAFSPAGLQRDLEAFAAADVVLAPHGAGLANIVGCPPWAHVVELLARPVNIMYGSMCARLGLKWHALTPAVASHSGVIKAEVGLVVDRVREASKAIRDLAKRFASFSSSQRAVCAA
ncbi:hypothetical protein FNF31_04923 [Cafeteria roenbergensis]|uniref:Uncharacterized protein n=1 Tax=Cafeteria roenbergensis TaxID=33653 RepID=A0A5A8D210_CAFRO|nr:hypothetical protein FNF31_04923 [Cafeteria roenbergensis]